MRYELAETAPEQRALLCSESTPLNPPLARGEARTGRYTKTNSAIAQPRLQSGSTDARVTRILVSSTPSGTRTLLLHLAMIVVPRCILDRIDPDAVTADESARQGAGLYSRSNYLVRCPRTSTMLLDKVLSV